MMAITTSSSTSVNPFLSGNRTGLCLFFWGLRGRSKGKFIKLDWAYQPSRLVSPRFLIAMAHSFVSLGNGSALSTVEHNQSIRLRPTGLVRQPSSGRWQPSGQVRLALGENGFSLVNNRFRQIPCLPERVNKKSCSTEALVQGKAGFTADVSGVAGRTGQENYLMFRLNHWYRLNRWCGEQELILWKGNCAKNIVERLL